MALRIFDVDPDARPKKGFADDLVGRFRSGAQVNGRPLALSEWRVTTGDPDVADAIAAALGGTPEEWDTKTEETLEVYTAAPSVRVLLDGPQAVRTSMALWGRNNKKVRECDGVTQMDDAKSPCVCPDKVADRKVAAKEGTGCEPSISIFFRLADEALRDLGKFRFQSGSWSMAAEIGEAEAKLADINGPAIATLSLERVEYTTKAGREVSYTKPVLKVLGPSEADS